MILQQNIINAQKLKKWQSIIEKNRKVTKIPNKKTFYFQKLKNSMKS